MQAKEAEIRVKAIAHPWRVGILIDPSDENELGETVRALSSTWCGTFMPIFDKSLPLEEIESLCALYGLDNLYGKKLDKDLESALRKKHLLWQFGYSPFPSEKTLNYTLPSVTSVLNPDEKLSLYTWDDSSSEATALTAIWGAASISAPNTTYVQYPHGHEEYGEIGTIKAISRFLDLSDYMVDNTQCVLYIMNKADNLSVIKFWNLRAIGLPVCGIIADSEDHVLQRQLTAFEADLAGKNIDEIIVVNYTEPSEPTPSVIQSFLERSGHSVNLVSDVNAYKPVSFSGVPDGRAISTQFTKTSRVKFESSAHGIWIDLPDLPLSKTLPAYLDSSLIGMRFEILSVSGQDPRFTPVIPPHRRFLPSLRPRRQRVDLQQISVSKSGLSYGLPLGTDSTYLQFLFCLDISRTFLGDDNTLSSQSDIGKFQTRAAEKFKGPFVDYFKHAGARTALIHASRASKGVSLQELRNQFRAQSENWINPIRTGNQTAVTYAKQQVDTLLFSELLVPIISTHCTFCRVDTYIDIELAKSKMNCEFCGASYLFGISDSLRPSKIRYRLASQLNEQEVKALLPVLATTATLGDLLFTDMSPPLVLGQEFQVGGRKMEADIAMYDQCNDVLLLGELKYGNRIDPQDISNMITLRDNVQETTPLLVFATLKKHLTSTEITDLRSMVDRCGYRKTRTGQLVEDLPMILTEPDLSAPKFHEDHPGTWGQIGIFSVAYESCKRNLGLVKFKQGSNEWDPTFLEKVLESERKYADTLRTDSGELHA